MAPVRFNRGNPTCWDLFVLHTIDWLDVRDEFEEMAGDDAHRFGVDLYDDEAQLDLLAVHCGT